MPSAEQAVAGGSLEQSEVIKMALHPALGVKTHELKRRTGLASTPRGSPSETEQELDHCVLLISANGVLSFFFFFYKISVSHVSRASKANQGKKHKKDFKKGICLRRDCLQPSSRMELWLWPVKPDFLPGSHASEYILG